MIESNLVILFLGLRVGVPNKFPHIYEREKKTTKERNTMAKKDESISEPTYFYGRTLKDRMLQDTEQGKIFLPNKVYITQKTGFLSARIGDPDAYLTEFEISVRKVPSEFTDEDFQVVQRDPQVAAQLAVLPSLDEKITLLEVSVSDYLSKEGAKDEAVKSEAAAKLKAAKK